MTPFFKKSAKIFQLTKNLKCAIRFNRISVREKIGHFSQKNFSSTYTDSAISQNSYDSPAKQFDTLTTGNDEIKSTLIHSQLPFTENNEFYLIKYCPSCPPHKDNVNNLFKLHVWKNRGGFYCHRCLVKGNFEKLKILLGASLRQKNMKELMISSEAARKLEMRRVTEKNTTRLEKFVREAQNGLANNLLDGRTILREQRGLTEETLNAYQTGVAEWSFFTQFNGGEKQVSVVYPWFALEDGAPTLIRAKVRSLLKKSNQCISPTGGEWGFFGYNLIGPEDEEVVLTEGEFDALSVFQATGKKAISLPIGCNSLPIDLLQMLKQFKRIYLWMDNDINGQEAAEKFSRKLGIERCFIVGGKVLAQAEDCRPVKDANEALLCGMDLNAFLEGAKLIPHKQISFFGEIKEDVRREILNLDEKRGIQLLTLPGLNGFLKGHRSGELTILTGQTGVGKTTFLSQISIDLAQQGVRTLWGSFEIKNPRLGKVMLNQYSGENMELHPERFEQIANDFGALPIYFLRFFGATDIQEVLDAMEYANHVYDVKHIILDNLQFMLGYSNRLNKFDQIDWAISTLRIFASTKNVHITVVIHPRKEQDKRELGISSIFGSAKAAQEADNVVVLDKNDQEMWIHVKKNRFSGHLGSVEYNYDTELRIFSTKDSPSCYGRPLGVSRAFLTQQNQEQEAATVLPALRSGKPARGQPGLDENIENAKAEENESEQHESEEKGLDGTESMESRSEDVGVGNIPHTEELSLDEPMKLVVAEDYNDGSRKRGGRSSGGVIMS